MRIDVSLYELIARSDLRRRAGALLRATFADGVRGYADLHPWPEFGDAPLNSQLERLAASGPTPLGERSLSLARADGEARSRGICLFSGRLIPPSHASLPYGHKRQEINQAISEGFRQVKLKGWDFSREDLAFFKSNGLKYRLDFNGKPDASRVAHLLEGWGDLNWIDWIEDPCPYDADVWQAIQRRFGIRIAVDFEKAVEEAGFDVRVVKPARDRTPVTTRPLAFTSYLDHPVGQLGAAWEAVRAEEEGHVLEAGGLVTHTVYEPTPFSLRLGVREGRLVPPEGPGIGFGKELDAQPWRSLLP